MPELWAGPTVTAWVGSWEVALQRGAEQVSHPRHQFGGRWVRYRHYLGELSRKPQALRHIAPELVEELGGPYAELWTLLETERGGHDAAAALARLLLAASEYGEEAVQEALETGRYASPSTTHLTQETNLSSPNRDPRCYLASLLACTLEACDDR